MRWMLLLLLVAAALIHALKREPSPLDPRVVDFARASTAADALFVVPPDWGAFRLEAARAIVADWKAFPYTDAAIRRWYKRLIAVYGSEPTLEAMLAAYTKIDDTRLFALTRQFGADYAVLSLETPSRLPVVFQTETFQVVSLH